MWLPVLLLARLGEPFQRGFYCDDTSIRHPYKTGTIPNYVLYIVGVGLPVIAVSHSMGATLFGLAVVRPGQVKLRVGLK